MDSVPYATARAAYLRVLNWWHEADPDHCGGECFRESTIATALGHKPKHEARKPSPLTMIGRGQR